MKTIQPEGPYRLAGYSFGACVAIEMTHQLLRHNQHTSLTLLDGSHRYVSAHTEQYKSKMEAGNEAQAQTEALCAFAHLFVDIDYAEV